MRPRPIAELLTEQRQLATLPEAQLATMAGCAHLEVVAAGTKLAREGDPADTFFVVRTGLVAIEARSPGASVRIDSAGPGELVGWSWIFPPHTWSFDVRTIDQTRLLVVDGACLRDKCEADHEFGYQLMRCFSALLVGRLTSTRLRLLDIYGRS